MSRFAEGTSAQACAVTSSRFAVDRVSVKQVDGRHFAVATDGRIYACVPVDLRADGADKVGLYPAIAFRVARDRFRQDLFDSFDLDDAGGHDHPDACCLIELVEDGVAEVGDTTFQQPAGEPFPAAKPEWSQGEPVTEVHLDVAYLTRLAAALGTTKVALEVRNPLEAVKVRPVDGHGQGRAFGFIMPLAQKAAGGGA